MRRRSVAACCSPERRTFCSQVGRSRQCFAEPLPPLVAFAAWTAAAQAHDGYPAIPPELGIHSPAGYGWVPYRCADWPVANFYHNAWYAHQAPAVYGNHVYRPFYRYTAWRVVPRTYYCVQ